MDTGKDSVMTPPDDAAFCICSSATGKYRCAATSTRILFVLRIEFAEHVHSSGALRCQKQVPRRPTTDEPIHRRELMPVGVLEVALPAAQHRIDGHNHVLDGLSTVTLCLRADSIPHRFQTFLANQAPTYLKPVPQKLESMPFHRQSPAWVLSGCSANPSHSPKRAPFPAQTALLADCGSISPSQARLRAVRRQSRAITRWRARG